AFGEPLGELGGDPGTAGGGGCLDGGLPGGCLLRGSWFDGGRFGRGFLRRRLLRSRPGRGLGRFADRLGGLFATLPAGAGWGGSAHQDTSSRARRWSRTTGPSAVTSPAPTVRITSPGRALSATARAASWA